MAVDTVDNFLLGVGWGVVETRIALAVLEFAM